MDSISLYIFLGIAVFFILIRIGIAIFKKAAHITAIVVYKSVAENLSKSTLHIDVMVTQKDGTTEVRLIPEKDGSGYKIETQRSV